MERNLAEALGAPVSVKATTNEGMGCDRPRRGHRLHRAWRSLGRRTGTRLSSRRWSSVDPLSLARKVKLGSLGSLPDVPFNLKTLAEAGVIRPMRPDKLARVARELAPLGRLARRPGSPARRSPIPTTRW